MQGNNENMVLERKIAMLSKSNNLFPVLNIFTVPNKPNIFADDSSLSFGPDKEKVEVTVGGKVTLFTGSMLTIKCPVIGKPPPRVWWLGKGKPISVGKAKMIGNDLVIDKIDKIFSLDYTCNARNFRGSASAITSVIVLGKLLSNLNCIES